MSSSDLLQQIQSLQFTQKERAEALLGSFVREVFALDVTHVELRPLAVSLNSFNGFLTLVSGQRLFFKTHTEPDSVISEYYNAALLAEAGYPVIQPLYRSTEAGRQFLLYEVVDDPSVFDIAWVIEAGQSDAFPALTRAQQQADTSLFRLYLDALEVQSSQDAASASVNQLFYHRLTGGRLAKFYGPLPGEPGEDVPITLPHGTFSMSEVLNICWVINGQRYEPTLNDLIAEAVAVLQPAQAGPSIVGHGDAHNGNVFFRQATGEMLYFDPAFAGRHHPLLDLSKPLFHNVFAMWMYFPREKAAQMRITLVDDGSNIWRVEHDYTLPPVREMFLTSKVEHVLVPTLRELKRRQWLRSDWRRYLKSALLCCPFLTMNLADLNKFPPEISLLGLAMSVEMGAESQDERSRIDCVLDEVDRQL
jgi:hypothetical protein